MNMVNWPEPNRRWHDTGEGGLYAYLVVPLEEEPRRSTGGCCVCTYTYLTRADVCLNGADDINAVWDPAPEFGEDDATHLDAARETLRNIGHTESADKLGNLIGYDQLSVPLAACVFLGATSNALYDDENETYFLVTHDRLNATGRALHAALQRQHPRPLLMTFLDT